MLSRFPGLTWEGQWICFLHPVEFRPVEVAVKVSSVPPFVPGAFHLVAKHVQSGSVTDNAIIPVVAAYLHAQMLPLLFHRPMPMLTTPVVYRVYAACKS